MSPDSVNVPLAARRPALSVSGRAIGLINLRFQIGRIIQQGGERWRDSRPAMTGCTEFEIMSVEDMPDERLVRFYENVRQQVEADRAGNHKFMMDPTVQQYADQLQSEMIKRGLEHSPIEWPPEMARKHREVVDRDGQHESNPVATGKSPMIGVRMHEEMQDPIENPAERNDHPSLSGAVRSLVERGLKAKK